MYVTVPLQKYGSRRRGEETDTQNKTDLNEDTFEINIINF